MFVLTLEAVYEPSEVLACADTSEALMSLNLFRTLKLNSDRYYPSWRRVTETAWRLPGRGDGSIHLLIQEVPYYSSLEK